MKTRMLTFGWLALFLVMIGAARWALRSAPVPAANPPTARGTSPMPLPDVDVAALPSSPGAALPKAPAPRMADAKLPAGLPAEQVAPAAPVYMAGDQPIALGRVRGMVALTYAEDANPVSLWQLARAAGFTLREHDPVYQVLVLSHAAGEQDLPALATGWSGVEQADWVYADPVAHAPVVVTPRIIAQLRPGADAGSYARKTGLRYLREIPGLARVAVFQAPSPLAFVAAHANDPEVVWMEPDLLTKKRTAYQPNDTYFNQLWHLYGVPFRDRDTNAHLYATAAWDISRGDSNVVVAVLDDGFILGHEDLTNRVFINTGEYGDGKQNNGIDDDTNGYIDDWQGWNFRNHDNVILWDYHGSAVAALAVAQGDNAKGICGVAYESRFLPVVLGLDEEFTSYADVAAALAYAGQFADVINNSWGGYTYSLVEEAAVNAVSAGGRAGKGCAVVCAAGNGNTTVAYPARYANAVAVGATEHRDRRATYSNRGAELDVMAPAGDGYAALWAPDLYGGYNWQHGWNGYTNSVAVSGVYTLEWVFVNCPTQQFVWRGGIVGEKWDSAWVDNIALPGGDTEGFESGGLASWPWETGGHTNWAAETFKPFAGSYAARAGDLVRTNVETRTYLRIVTNLVAGDITFRYYVSSFQDVVNGYFDRLAFVVNGVTQAQFSGESGDTDGFYRDGFSGTSASSPLVAGAAALLYAVYPDLTAAEARMALRQCADKVGPEAYDVGRNDSYGWGRVNAGTLLQGPVIVSTPSAVGAVGAAYSYDADNAAKAIGQGAISWGTNSAPAGFQIHPTNGAIAWVPTNRGPQRLAIQAVSGPRTNVQEWMVHVRADFYVNDAATVSDVYCSAVGAAGNDGLASNTPQLSVQAIIDLYDLGPGDRLFVDTGTYNLTNSLTITTNDGGSAEGFLSVIGSPNGTIIDRILSTNRTFCLKVDGASYLCVSNLTLRRGQYGLWANQCKYSRFSGLTIRDAARDGVLLTNGVHNTLSGLDVQGCGHHGVTVNRSQYATLDHCLVANNSSNGVVIYFPTLCALASSTLAYNGHRQIYLYTGTDEELTPAPLVVSNSIIVARGTNAVGVYLEGSDLYGPFYRGDYNNLYAEADARVGESHGFAAMPLCYTLEEWQGIAHADSNSLSHNPLFAATNDFHVASVVGRYAGPGSWVQDANHSPCIDLGDPRAGVGAETEPNGGRLNLGAYGGTAQASRSRTNAWLLARSPNRPDWSGTLSGVVVLAWAYGEMATNEQVNLQYSANYGVTWSTLEAGLRVDTGAWAWDTTNASSSMQGLWRVLSPKYSAADANDGSFIIRNTNAVFGFYVNDTNSAGDIYCTAPGNDLNPGSSAAPKATIQPIINHVNLEPGDTIYVDTGRYNLSDHVVFSYRPTQDWADDGGDTNHYLTLRGAGRGTVLDRTSRVSTAYNVYLYYADWVKVANLMVTNGGSGIYIRNTENAAVEDVEVYGAVNGITLYYADNNRISQCLVHDCSTDGMDIQGSTNIQVRNCTLSRNDSQLYVRSTSEVDARNCIFNTHQGGSGYYCVEVNPGSVYAGDNNQFSWPTNGYLGYYGSSVYTSLVQWAEGIGQDSNSLAGATAFRDLLGANYRLKYGAMAIDRGVTELAPSNDIEGVVRPIDGDFDGFAIADMGCYEYNPANSDSDGDGMLDDWERGYGLNPTNSEDAGLDPDLDRLSNLEESIADTVPTNAGSVFMLDTAAASAGGIVLTWRSATGRLYGVSVTTNLVPVASFLPLATNLPATPMLNSYTDSVYNVEQHIFYRINVRKAP